MTTATVPGLERGITLLRFLEKGDRYSLEQLARLTGIPKASLLRILATLEKTGCVERNLMTKAYRATVHLVPASERDELFSQRLLQVLFQLSHLSGQTAEWWVPSSPGMVLVSRQEPPPDRGEIRVVARVGFIRHWDDELDAVAALAFAFLPGRNLPAHMRGYRGGAEKCTLSGPEIADRIARASRQRWDVDHFFNQNGVSRLAVAVQKEDRLLGIAALAGTYTWFSEKSEEERFSLLQSISRCVAGLTPGHPPISLLTPEEACS